jgi:phosphoglycolate phosphatase
MRPSDHRSKPRTDTPFDRDLIVYDLDGTLIDSAPDLAVSVNHALAHFGYPPRDDEHIRRSIGNGAIKLIERCLPTPDAMDTQAFYQVFLAHYIDHATEQTIPYPGVPELLERLHRAGIRQAVLTNKPEAPSRTILERLGLMPWIDAVIGGDTLPERKPDPAGLFRLMEQFGATPERTLMVGDASPDAGAALAAGVELVLIRGGFGKSEELDEFDPEWSVENFAQLLEPLEPVAS